jgi:ubiquinone/menaquinone biosynthesis C-methylase UbiE
VGVLYGHAFDLPFKNEYFDLVFSAGVLIHIPPDHLPEALREIYRVSKRYLLSIEYFAEQETVIHYRGHEDLLWKRNFFQHWQAQFADLVLIRK